MPLPQPPQRPFDEVLAGLTEEALTPGALLALPIGERMAALALSVSGLGADDTPEGRLELYLRVVCPERETFASQKIYQNVNDWRVMFSCGLVARSHLRRLGVRAPELGLTEEGYVPYKSGMAVSDVLALAQHRGVWKTKGLPPLGSVVVVGEGLSTHVFCLTKPIDPSDLLATSVDGGQPVGVIPYGGTTKSLEGIKTCLRPVTVLGQAIVFGSRTLLGYLDPTDLVPDAPPTMDLV